MRSLILVLMSTAAVMCHAQESCKVATPPVIDAQTDEWTTTWVDDDKEKFKYNICFDDARLYIRLKVTDELTQHKMAAYGFTVWMDPNGKKKEKLGLRYPTGIEGSERVELFRQSGEDLSKENNLNRREERKRQLKKGLVDNVEVLELIGLADQPLTSSKSGITNGILVAIDMDSEGNYVYEAAIPFKAFRLSKAQLSVLGVGFETGKITVNQTKGKGNAAGGGMQSGGFGDNSSSRGNGYSEMAVPVKMWTSIKLN